MGWRIRVVHTTGYRYAAPVHESYNEARLTPRSDHRQNVIVSRVETTCRRPGPTATPTTGAPRSPRSTCTPRTPSWP